VISLRDLREGVYQVYLIAKETGDYHLSAIGGANGVKVAEASYQGTVQQGERWRAELVVQLSGDGLLTSMQLTPPVRVSGDPPSRVSVQQHLLRLIDEGAGCQPPWAVLAAFATPVPATPTPVSTSTATPTPTPAPTLTLTLTTTVQASPNVSIAFHNYAPTGNKVVPNATNILVATTGVTNNGDIRVKPDAGSPGSVTITGAPAGCAITKISGSVAVGSDNGFVDPGSSSGNDAFNVYLNMTADAENACQGGTISYSVAINVTT
jgi:hypothetical protein